MNKSTYQSVYIDHQGLMEIKSMPMLKTEIGDHECHSGNWKVVDFDVFVVKEPN